MPTHGTHARVSALMILAASTSCDAPTAPKRTCTGNDYGAFDPPCTIVPDVQCADGPACQAFLSRYGIDEGQVLRVSDATVVTSTDTLTFYRVEFGPPIDCSSGCIWAGLTIAVAASDPATDRILSYDLTYVNADLESLTAMCPVGSYHADPTVCSLNGWHWSALKAPEVATYASSGTTDIQRTIGWMYEQGLIP